MAQEDDLFIAVEAGKTSQIDDLLEKYFQANGEKTICPNIVNCSPVCGIEIFNKLASLCDKKLDYDRILGHAISKIWNDDIFYYLKLAPLEVDLSSSLIKPIEVYGKYPSEYTQGYDFISCLLERKYDPNWIADFLHGLSKRSEYINIIYCLLDFEPIFNAIIQKNFCARIAWAAVEHYSVKLYFLVEDKLAEHDKHEFMDKAAFESKWEFFEKSKTKCNVMCMRWDTIFNILNNKKENLFLDGDVPLDAPLTSLPLRSLSPLHKH